jgi:hypothetical protein
MSKDERGDAHNAPAGLEARRLSGDHEASDEQGFPKHGAEAAEGDWRGREALRVLIAECESGPSRRDCSFR